MRDGVATLRGDVPDAEARERVLKAAGSAPGIVSVQDQLAVSLPPALEESPTTVPAPPEPEPARPAVPQPDPPAPEPVVTAPPVKEPAPAQAQQIAIAIVTYSGYTVFDHVQFSLEGADVVLLGAVTTPSKKQELEARIRAVAGVGGLRNEIRILANSKEDQRLREKLFRRIYEDALFAEFADDPNPPVHILVEGGLVTLTGIVGEAMQKMSAEAMVHNVFGVTLVLNRIRVRER